MARSCRVTAPPPAAAHGTHARRATAAFPFTGQHACVPAREGSLAHAPALPASYSHDCARVPLRSGRSLNFRVAEDEGGGPGGTEDGTGGHRPCVLLLDDSEQVAVPQAFVSSCPGGRCLPCRGYSEVWSRQVQGQPFPSGEPGQHDPRTAGSLVLTGLWLRRLPKKDNPRRGLWLANCQRLDPSGQGLWDPASEYIYFCSKHFEENCFELVGISGYHRLKEGAVPTIFETFSKLRRTGKTKGHRYSPGLPDVSRLRRCRKRCSEGRGPTTPFSPPPPADVTCFPAEEASAPAALPASPTGRLEPGLSSPFSDLLGPLGAQADEAGCSAQPSPERQPSPLEPRPISPSAYMLRLPPPAGAYIQNEHSYQVGSALLWKRRAEAALDALDKAQRQLQACKRREQRLRLRLTKLQQERAREKRAQADARQTLKEHVQDFAMQLSSSMA